MDLGETKSRVPLLLRLGFLACAAFLIIANVLDVQNFSMRFTKPLFKNTFAEDRSLQGFLINTPGCKIPYMDPFDPLIKKFIKKPSKIVCNKGKPPLFASNLTSVYLLDSFLQDYNVENFSDLRCCYRPFWRVDLGNGTVKDNNIKLSSVCETLRESADIRDEFILVTCTSDNTTIYKDTFAFVPLKNTTKATTLDPKKLNVLIVGLDSVSRINFHRQMIKTATYLKQYETVELLGYNKVGDNTFPNLMPVLAGLNVEELKNSCWPHSKSHFDDCPFIWKLYKRKDYVTAYGEDSSWMGIFNYQRYGFRKQPTDYAYNYFNKYSEDVIGNSHKVNVIQCEGGRVVYKDFLDYITNFVVTMDANQLPYFGFFWGVGLSHDTLNLPNLGDDDYYRFFKKLVEENHLDRTVLIFMSDHGIRWGDIRQTFQGRMEERLPFVYILVPDSFKTTYSTAYRHLVTNARRLTTPYDLHETLVDLLEPSKLLEENSPGGYSDELPRGISFFKPINKRRTCEEAAISSHWCTCQESTAINVTSEVVEAAQAAVDHINYELSGYSQCAKLTLDLVADVRLMKPIVAGSNEIYDYMITFKTLPGAAIFEATLRSSSAKTAYEVIGTISRLNLYGKQSLCITDFHLKLYCYCNSLL